MPKARAKYPNTKGLSSENFRGVPSDTRGVIPAVAIRRRAQGTEMVTAKMRAKQDMKSAVGLSKHPSTASDALNKLQVRRTRSQIRKTARKNRETFTA